MKANSNSAPRVVAALVVGATLALTSTGCLWAPELARVKDDIERQVPGANFHKEFAISLGPVSLGFAKMITALIPDAREARGYLRHVNRIQVAVYEVDDVESMAHVELPRRLTDLADEGWEMAVKVREADQRVWVMYRIDGERIRDLYVVVLEPDEMVLVKASGNLERLVARAMIDAQDVPGVPRMDEKMLAESDKL